MGCGNRTVSLLVQRNIGSGSIYPRAPRGAQLAAVPPRYTSSTFSEPIPYWS